MFVPRNIMEDGFCTQGEPQQSRSLDEKCKDDVDCAVDGLSVLCDEVSDLHLVALNDEISSPYEASCSFKSIIFRKGNFVDVTYPPPKKKLLILDINGLLAVIAKKTIFKRPFCSEFLNFCFDRFDVGIWSSRTKRNVDRVVNSLMGDLKHRLLFCWDLSHCTATGFHTLENKHKPLVFKELRKIWEKYDPGLPWEKGYFNESNTLLVDDSPYKALLNPRNTAIFPYPYNRKDVRDNSLSSGGDIRAYLEQLHLSEDVRGYVAEHPFGQRAITETNSSWDFYYKVESVAPQGTIKGNIDGAIFVGKACSGIVAKDSSAKILVIQFEVLKIPHSTTKLEVTAIGKADELVKIDGWLEVIIECDS